MPSTVIDSRIYGDIFSTKPMRAIWSDDARIARYLDVEVALAKVQAELHIIPREAAEAIAGHARLENLDFAALKTATEHIGYPVLPVVQQLSAGTPDGLGQWCHWGATTQDITDTATVLQMRASLEVVEEELKAIAAALRGLARKHRDTPMVGRSNLQQAVPVTFGYKAAVWLSGVERSLERLGQLKPRVLIGEFAGAAGTLASLGSRGMEVQAGLCRELGLGQPAIAWHTMRDTVAEAGSFLGLACGVLSKIAVDVKIAMATEVGELAEPYSDGRGSSSTMPQKRNPISCAYITSINDVVRQHVAVLMGSMTADFERSTGPWESDWIALPEIFCLTAGALHQARFMLEGLEVHDVAMLRNLKLTDGLVCSEAVMMALAPVVGREAAHDRLSAVCLAVAHGKGRFINLLKADPVIAKSLGKQQLERLVNPMNYLGSSGEMVDRLLAATGGSARTALG